MSSGPRAPSFDPRHPSGPRAPTHVQPRICVQNIRSSAGPPSSACQPSDPRPARPPQPASPQLRSPCHPSSPERSLFPGENPKPYCLGFLTLSVWSVVSVSALCVGPRRSLGRGRRSLCRGRGSLYRDPALCVSVPALSLSIEARLFAFTVALCVGLLRSLCWALALSRRGSALSVSGPGAFCVATRILLCRVVPFYFSKKNPRLVIRD